VEFLVLTSVVWEPWEEKQELQLVDVTDKLVTLVKHMVLESWVAQVLTMRGARVDVTFHGRQAVDTQDRVHSVETGPSVVLEDQDKVVQE
tara:strand:+ start:32 stop:301 length:270 start_codon:yes stop_codon:yes gene_type:complete